jgi:fumarate hydratase subunit beta
MTAKRISLPLGGDEVSRLKSGDRVRISGELFTARDAVHQRFHKLLAKGCKLPVNLRGQTLFYAGPAPAPRGKVIGSIGPTTSGRMDAYTPLLLARAGLKAMIGKGRRSPEVIEAIKKNKAVYFAATGGAAALLAQTVVKAEMVLFSELGPEAVLKLTVKDLPAVVAVDCWGRDVYEEGPKRFRKPITNRNADSR